MSDLDKVRTSIPLRVLHDTYVKMDATLAGLAREGRRQTPVPLLLACRSGCAECCAYVAHVLPVEAANVVVGIQALPESERQAVVDRLFAWAALWRRRMALDPHGLERPSQIDWQVERYACPMLDPERLTCLVYDRRPTACRAHHAVNSKPGETVQACGSCAVVQPPEACVTTEQHRKCGHFPAVFQLRADLIDRFAIGLWNVFTALGAPAEALAPDVLAIAVLEAGRRMCGWERTEILAVNRLPARPNGGPSRLAPP